MRYTIGLVFVLAFIWLVNSGHYTPLILGFGVFSVTLVTFIARRMQIVDSESMPVQLLLALPGYYFWLYRKIIASNLEVAASVWSSLLPGRDHKARSISPISRRIPLKLQTDLGKTMFANSITLTPGTVAVDIDGDSLLVHALTRAGLEDLELGEMQTRIARLVEGKLVTQEKSC